MNSAWNIFRWELRRVLTNWRQAMTIFVIPSFVLLLVLYLFPLLMDFMATGNLGRPTLYFVNSPTSFSEYINTKPANLSYKTSDMDESMFAVALLDGSAKALAEQGSAFVVFSSFPRYEDNKDSATSFEGELERYYLNASSDNQAGSLAFISVLVDPDNMKSTITAKIFEMEILPEYKDFLSDTVGNEYVSAGGGRQFSINVFNPFSEIMLHRSVANASAARVLPAALFLLLYYCIYSIAFDAIGAERERGFLAKVSLTPVRKIDIIVGKAGAVALIGLLNSVSIIVVFIIASWTNFSNNPFSLIPFGFTPFPLQMASILLLITCAAVVLSLFCFIVIFSCNRPQDVILNLQIPLLIFLVYFFVNIYRSTSSHPFEVFIPIHGALTMMREVLLNNASTSEMITVVASHVAIAIILLVICRKIFKSSYSYNEIEERR